MPKEIKLNRDYTTIIDDEDYERVIQHSWHASPKSFGNTVAVQAKINGKFTYLHRFLINPPDNMVVDHIDRNPLNNQKSNLRICTRSENQKNKLQKPKTSKYKGVSLCDDGKGYQATIRIQRGKQTYLGYFKSEIEAADAYNQAAKEHHGDFALLNDVIFRASDKQPALPNQEDKLTWLKDKMKTAGSITSFHQNKTFIDWHNTFYDDKPTNTARRALGYYMNILVEEGYSLPCTRVGVGSGAYCKFGSTLQSLWVFNSNNPFKKESI